MDFFECVAGRRSTRRFKQDPIPREDFDRMIDAGRYAPTGFNKQPVRFAVISSPGKVAEAFKFTGWLTGKPPEGSRPAGYVVILNDNDVMGGDSAVHCATYAVMLAGWALGYGSCWHGVSKTEEMSEFLGLGGSIESRILVSLGKPDEPFVVEDPSTDWKVSKGDDGTVRLGKLGRDDVTLAVL